MRKQAFDGTHIILLRQPLRLSHMDKRRPNKRRCRRRHANALQPRLRHSAHRQVTEHIKGIAVPVGDHPSVLGKLVICPHGLRDLRFESRLEADVAIAFGHELVVREGASVQRSVEGRGLDCCGGTRYTSLGCYILEDGTIAAGCAIHAPWPIARTSKVLA
jgi:hypothetical protein